MKIILENFQNIDYAEIDLEKGLNIITGLNGQGKTCLFRALHSLIFNPKRVRKGFKKNTEGYIQNGKEYCKVTISCTGFPTVSWECTKEGTTYTVNGKIFTKSVGGLSLVDLVPHHPFSIYANECLNLASQKAGALLFDRSSSTVFNLIDNLYEIVDTATETQNFKNYRQQLATKQDRIKETLQVTEDAISNIERVRNKVPVEKLQTAFSKYKVLKEKFTFLQEVLFLAKKKKHIHELSIDELETSLQSLKSFKLLQELQDALQHIDSLGDVLKNYPENTVSKLQSLQEIEELVITKTTYEDTLISTEKDLVIAKSEIKGTICPTCHQEIRM